LGEEYAQLTRLAHDRLSTTQLADGALSTKQLDDNFAARTPIALASEFDKRITTLDDILFSLRESGASSKLISRTEAARSRLQSKLNKTLDGEVRADNIDEARRLFSTILKGADTETQVSQALENIPDGLKVENWLEALPPLADARLKQLRKSGERTAFTRELQSTLDALKPLNTIEADPFADAAAAVAVTLDAMKLSKGRVRQLGGMTKLLDNVALNIRDPKIKEFITSLNPSARKKFITQVNKLLFQPARQGTIDTVRKEAARLGLSLDVREGATALRLGNHTKNFSSLSGARKYLSNLENESDPLALQAQAARKAVTVKHVGNNEFVVADHNTGTVQSANGAEDAARIVASKPDVDTPELVSQPPITMPGVMRRPGLGGDDQGIDIDMPIFKAGHLPKKGLVSGFRSLATLAQDLESVYGDQGVKAFTQFFRPFADAEINRRNFEQPFVDVLRTVRKTLPRRRDREIAWELFLSPDTVETVTKHLGAQGRHVRAASNLRKWFAKLGVDPDEVGDIARNARRTGGDQSRLLEGMALPATLEPLRTAILDGRVRFHENDPTALASDILRSFSNNMFIEPAWQAGARETFKAMEQIVRKSPSSHDAKFGQDILDHIRAAIEGRPDKEAARVADFLGGFQDRLQKFGLLRGRDRLSARDAERLGRELTQLYSGSAMSLRPALAIRNLMQSFLPGAKTGFGWNLKAQSYVHSNWDKAVQQARDSGALGSDLQGLYLFDDFSAISEGLVRRAQKAGMKFYRWADKRNRVVSYHNGRMAVEHYGNRLAQKKISTDEFLLRTGLAGSSDVAQRSVLQKLRTQGVEAAASEYGRLLSDETQFLYSRLGVPLHYQSTVGRLFGQFGIWPAAYSEYVVRNMGLGTQGGVESVRGAYRKRFASRMVGLWGLTQLGGEALDLDLTQWNFSNPLSFEGGPIPQLVQNTVDSVTGSEFERDLARRNLLRGTRTLIPFAGLTKDIEEALAARRPGDALLLLMGFNLAGERRKRQRKDARR
jgi:hypothetical protein